MFFSLCTQNPGKQVLRLFIVIKEYISQKYPYEFLGVLVVPFPARFSARDRTCWAAGVAQLVGEFRGLASKGINTRRWDGWKFDAR